MHRAIVAIFCSLLCIGKAHACSCADDEGSLEQRIPGYSDIFVVRVDEASQRPTEFALAWEREQRASGRNFNPLRAGMIENVKLTVVEVLKGSLQVGDRFEITHTVEVGNCNLSANNALEAAYGVEDESIPSDAYREWLMFRHAEQRNMIGFFLCGDTAPVGLLAPGALDKVRGMMRNREAGRNQRVGSGEPRVFLEVEQLPEGAFRR